MRTTLWIGLAALLAAVSLGFVGTVSSEAG